MHSFSYTAIDIEGRKVRGAMDATNEIDLESRLERMGLDLIKAKEKKERQYTLTKRKITRKEIIDFTMSMEQLLRAGVPMIESLYDIRDSLPQSYMRQILSSVLEEIQGGRTLSEALGNYKKEFGEIYVTTISVGERTGNLSEVMFQLVEDLKWQDEMVSRVTKLTIYPAFVLSIIVVVISGLMVFVVPDLVSFLENIGGELPLSTRLLILFGELFNQYWWIMVLVPVGLVALVKIGRSVSYKFKLETDRLLLKVPVFGETFLKIKVARFSQNFTLMYRSGITVLESVQLGKKLMNNLALEEAIDSVHLSISEGTGIADSFAQIGIFPSIVVRMIRVGEQGGNLDESLMNVIYFYSREIREVVDKAEATVGPTLAIILAIPIIFIIIAVLFPMYDTFQTLDTL